MVSANIEETLDGNVLTIDMVLEEPAIEVSKQMGHLVIKAYGQPSITQFLDLIYVLHKTIICSTAQHWLSSYGAKWRDSKDEDFQHYLEK